MSTEAIRREFLNPDVVYEPCGRLSLQGFFDAQALAK